MTPAVTPTQVRYPWRTVRRTIVQAGIPAVLTLGLVVPQIVQIILDEAGETMPARLRVWLLGASALVTAAAAVLTRIMAIPAVDRLLASWRLSAQPRPGDQP
jgi:hypothetical protein